ncbi:MAG TPA: adenylate/guanylate cyclase domain-containing protein [Gaiellaceae bacterium]|nr:adenylate/guanylate cyclase domain-containing protein [Gaiellaceae bacterium]
MLFCDLTGSTAMGERLDPEALRTTMRTYYEESRQVLERHGGTVEKFIGDAVMAVFGVPQAHEDDALRAVRAAAELVEAVAALGLEPRVGVNTGEVVAGEGDSLVVGDAVNVAARLEQVAEPGEILIGAETSRLVRDAVRLEPVELELKGKSAPVDAFRLIEIDPTAAGLERHLDSPLVGRRRELQRLKDDFEHALEQRSSQLFTLLGPAGVGKSRLVAEFMRDVDGRARVVTGRCLPYGEGITYWPLVEVLLQLGADAEAVLGMPTPAEAAVATRHVLEQEALERPLVVIFDDIQWAEPTFLELVEHVADWSRGAAIFLLCIARPELLELQPSWGGGKPNATSLLLEPLGEGDASSLIDNLLGDTALSDATRTRILEASQGNPLFVEEMLLMIRESGADGEIEVPPTIQALLQARIDRLAAAERSVIERGSVEGEVFHRLPVAELASLQVRSDLDGHLKRLIRNELIRPEPARLPGDDAFRFRHLLIRDAAYESLPKETRADLHERFALWVEEHVQLVEQDEIVGYHFEQAVKYRRELGRDDVQLARHASERMAAAGRAALVRGDNRAAASLIDRATQLLPAGDPARLPLLPPLADARLDLGRFDDVLTAIQELESAGDERWAAYGAVIRPMYGAFSGADRSLEESRDDILRAIETLGRAGDDAGLARAYTVLGALHWTNCRAADAGVAYRQALAHAERAGDPLLAEGARELLVTMNSHGPTPRAEAEAEVKRLRAHARGVAVESSADRALGRLAAMRGDFDEARVLVERGRSALKEAGSNIWYFATSQAPSQVEELAGNYEAALAILSEGFDQLDALGEHAFTSTNAMIISSLLCRLGREDEAADWIERARRLSPASDVATLAGVDYIEAMVLSRRGELDAAQELAQRALEQAEKTDFWDLRAHSREAAAEVMERSGREAEAHALLEEALAVYEDKGVDVEVDRLRSLLAKL